MPSIQTETLFSVSDIGIFSCPKCNKPMRLVCIEPGEPGFDFRTFECEKCHNTARFTASV